MRTKTVIIVVVFGVVGLVVLAGLWLWRRRVPANPLPPVQPLAHHRVSLYSPAHLSPIPRSLSPSSSRSTLHSKSNLRGTPHGTHSQTHLVLPAPLSQELPLERSAADSWVSPGTTPREF
jgi:hypothetical protein